MLRGVITPSQLEASLRRHAAESAAATAVSEYRATRMPTLTLQKPTPDMYGIWDGFDFEEHDLEERRFKYLRSTAVAIAYLLAGALLVIICQILFSNGKNSISTTKTTLTFYLIFSPILAIIYNKTNAERFLRASLTNYLIYSDNVAAYRANLSAWEFTNSERGLGYWQALRGIDFEHAIALLFRRRGCDVTTTKGSGDGGVDLILTVGAKIFWCQCKGHAKPVSVAPIREIAGVCSRSQAAPVILAVNGFTGPAIAAADELGVKCLGAADLCNLARLEAITSLDEIVRGIPLPARVG